MILKNFINEKFILKKYLKELTKKKIYKEKNISLINQINQLSEQKKNIESKSKNINQIGFLVGDLIKKIGKNRFIVKAPTGTNYIVSCENRINCDILNNNDRVALDPSTLTIMKVIKNKVDPIIEEMMKSSNKKVELYHVGGLEKQIKQIKELIELPFLNPSLFKQCGIKIPRGLLLYGPPGTGKTLLARYISCSIDSIFLKIVGSAIVDKYIGESARIIREIYNFAKFQKRCIIFIDEVDAIGGKRFSEGSSADREIHRTLIELLNQLDGYDQYENIKTIMATNRPDILDPALLRPGRLDRKILIPLPNRDGLSSILKIYFKRLNKKGSIDINKIIKICKYYNGADIRNLCTEAGLFSIRNERDFVIEDDFIKAVQKINKSKDFDISENLNNSIG
ncbi:26S proteasome AAA-ATPase subunit [Guillardia theta]|uniref:26S proteasome AAA-ATPase subunit n=1 Tax=Guillardia theta TaxID=55529 RepID=Q9AW43_GUITH|nr:26S proteasome AAA-ATPase subunit [Guillardia theta]CAC27027.1 26S proteasome AAA-ATPase subunit [Guillardia theta]|mmetsp:Transcript_17293/g.57209  ORF Transcript_17293/g.57209 Transcript_17293/m.57209 type:complete len:396 (+) Transcript_17293:4521-5708(+)